MTVSQNDGDVYYCDPGAIEVSRQGACCLHTATPEYTHTCSYIGFFWCQVAGAANSETAPAIAAVHAAISAVDVAAADAVHHAFTVITSHMQRVQQGPGCPGTSTAGFTGA